ncbi:Nickel transporter NicT [Capillimicrobium parvum]|uniref:Nickel/cobalt efflux system n=1 Tax=Capillimicrobium parvum TaxID=2884022 RepID=A0A9E6Y8W5_9ACTN|nr:HoxN/HupN/NixA family nickel/cobalt transporter [Capillimicrobium parvum]UGS39217.1 Nickel transporter NixA [Capillimicrobium parvum]
MLSRAEWTRVAAMAAVVVGLHVVGFGLLFAVVVPAHLDMGTAGVFTAGVGLTAYALGLRHAFDADHIAAIDNTTRKLMADGQRPLSVGFFFSLGHSTVVFVLAFLFSIGVRAVVGPVADDSSALHQITGVIGPSVSGTFLLVIAAINLAVLVGIVRAVRASRRGRCTGEELAARLACGGVSARLFSRVTRTITRPWQMYPLGLLFGLGFDTATEIALLFLAGGAAGAGLPWYAVLCLPVLFAAGMSLLDTIDGSFMNFAYGWAFSNPVRKVYYNLTVTGLSVMVALVIGSIEIAAVLADRLGLSGSIWDLATGADLNSVGYVVAGLFVVTWAAAILVWRVGRIEERWALPEAGAGTTRPPPRN